MRGATVDIFFKSCLVLILATLHGPSFSCPDHQASALLQFKSLLPGNRSTEMGLDTWNSNNITHCCQWSGVECSYNTVTCLILRPTFPILEPISSDIFKPLFHVRTLTELYLSYNEIEGEIPGTGLANLTQLVVLDLVGNRFSGSIPWQLFTLRFLESLQLADNSIEGNLENRLVEGSNVNIGIQNLTRLTSLSLNGNSLIGPIPDSISNLKNLIDLDLFNNNLAGKIPSSIGSLSNLQYLYLHHNNLSGEIPSSIGSMSNLQYLCLDHNNLSGEIPSSIRSLSNLQYLYLDHNNLSGEIPSSIQKLDNLVIIQLSENLLTGEIPLWLFDMKSLNELDLGDNRLTLSNKTLAAKSSVQIISLRSCNMSGEIPFWLTNQSILTSLDLSNNNLIGKIPEWLANTSLKTLNLSDNILLGPLAPSLFWNVETLDLGRNYLSEPLPVDFGLACSISFLMLHGNKLSGSLPRSMLNMTSLMALDLSSNRFSGNYLPLPPTIRYMDLHDNNIIGELPASLSNVTDLEVLNIRNNYFQNSIPSDLLKLNNLLILDLSHNNFSGEIPSSLGNLSSMSHNYRTFLRSPFSTGDGIYDRKAVMLDNPPEMEVFWKKFKQGLPGQNLGMYTFLDLSVNQLSGHIPSTLGSLKGLKSLNLSHNQLSEYIPPSLGQLQGLESLDLSYNNLTGKIPPTFSNLLELSYLDLSNNKLEGPIPNGPQMDRLNDPSFYANNNGLCGVQIQIACKKASTVRKQTQKSREKEETWFSWKMARVGFPVGFLSTILTMYAIGFFTFPPDRRPHHYVRQNFSYVQRRT